MRKAISAGLKRDRSTHGEPIPVPFADARLAKIAGDRRPTVSLPAYSSSNRSGPRAHAGHATRPEQDPPRGKRQVRGYVLEKLGEDWHYTLRDRKTLEDEIISALAGSAAEHKLTGRIHSPRWEHDHETAVTIASHLEGPTVVDPYLAYLDAKASAMIETNWRVVETLAAALVARKKLSGPDARRVMRRALTER